MLCTTVMLFCQVTEKRDFNLHKSTCLTVFLEVHASGPAFGYKVFAGYERLNTDSYYTLLRHHCILEQINGGSLNNIHWQQNGASCHRAHQNIHYLEG